MSETDITSEGKRLIEVWLAQGVRVEQAVSELNSARCAQANSERALAKWLMPSDAKAGEKIAVWHGDSLIQVEVKEGNGDHIVSIRKRGRYL